MGNKDRLLELRGLLTDSFTLQGGAFFIEMRKTFNREFDDRMVMPMLGIFAHKDLVGKLNANHGHAFVLDYFMMMKLQQIGYNAQELEEHKEIAYQRFMIEYMDKYNRDNPDIDMNSDNFKPLLRPQLEKILEGFLPLLDETLPTQEQFNQAYDTYINNHPHSKTPHQKQPKDSGEISSLASQPSAA
jgi:hypothetical protein